MALPQDDPKQRQPDISLAKAKLGWEPKINLADGLKPTVDYFRQDHLYEIVPCGGEELLPHNCIRPVA